jgi:hypothetical protein
LFGVRVDEHPILGSIGALYKDKSGFNIFVPRRLPVYRQRFACAHELAHVFLDTLAEDYRPILDEMAAEDRVWCSVEEVFCDLFAAEIVCPSDDLRRWVLSGISLHRFMGMVVDYRCSFRTAAIQVASVSESAVFVYARQRDIEPRKGSLAVEWSAQPSGVFVPRNKTIPTGSVLAIAFRSQMAARGFEDRPLEKIRRRCYVEAVPLVGKRAVLGVIHLGSPREISTWSLGRGMGVADVEAMRRGQLALWVRDRDVGL